MLISKSEMVIFTRLIKNAKIALSRAKCKVKINMFMLVLNQHRKISK